MKDPRQVLIRPVVSEKSYALQEANQYTFIVDPRASKPEIHDAVEAIFNVSVLRVNTLNRQGNDVGTQYRSAIFPLSDAQRAEAEAAIARWNAEHEGQQAVTTIEGPAEWYPAEDYHQEYWEDEGQRNPYCLATIPPKLMKLRKSFQDKVKGA